MHSMIYSMDSVNAGLAKPNIQLNEDFFFLSLYMYIAIRFSDILGRYTGLQDEGLQVTISNYRRVL